MPIDEYVERYSRAQRELDTINIEASLAFYSAAHRLRSVDGLVDYSTLANPEVRTEFAGNIITSLEQHIKDYFHMDDDQFNALDDFRKAQLMTGRYGLSPQDIKNIVEAHRDRINPQNYLEALQEPIGRVARILFNIPTSRLTQEDAQAVVDHVGANPNNPRNPDVRIAADRLTMQDMNYLLGQFIQHGAILERNIEGRLYRESA